MRVADRRLEEFVIGKAGAAAGIGDEHWNRSGILPQRDFISNIILVPACRLVDDNILYRLSNRDGTGEDVE